VTAGILSRAARALERAGADFLVLCTNTMHRVAPDIETAVDIPLLHIADATADGIRRAGLGKVGMLGTRFTMEHDFYRGRLRERHGVETLVPGEADREQIDRVIFDELVVGEVRPESRDVLLRSIRELVASGSEGIILGCTELGLLVGANDVAVPLFDTTELHARAAVARALD
jgi:aspartate racemase